MKSRKLVFCCAMSLVAAVAAAGGLAAIGKGSAVTTVKAVSLPPTMKVNRYIQGNALEQGCLQGAVGWDHPCRQHGRRPGSWTTCRQPRVRVKRPARVRIVLVDKDGWTPLATSRVLTLRSR